MNRVSRQAAPPRDGRPSVQAFACRQPAAVSDPGLDVADVLLGVDAGELLVDWRGRRLRAPRGSVLLLPRHQRRVLQALPTSGQFRCDWLVVSDHAASRFEQQHRALVDPGGDDADPGRLVVSRSQAAGQAWQQLRDALRDRAPLALVEHHLQAVLIHLALEVGRLPLAYLVRQSLPRQVAQLIESDPAHAWTAGDIAARLGRSEPTLRRQLASQQSSFRALLEDSRMQLALQLLKGSSRSVAQIATAVGYQCPSRFSARFRQRYGVPPRMMRSLHDDLLGWA